MAKATSDVSVRFRGAPGVDGSATLTPIVSARTRAWWDPLALTQPPSTSWTRRRLRMLPRGPGTWSRRWRLLGQRTWPSRQQGVDARDLSKDGVTRTDDHLQASQYLDVMEVTGIPVAKRGHVAVAKGDASDLTALATEPPMKATPGGRRSTTRLKTNVSERRTTGMVVTAPINLDDPGPDGVS